MKYHPMYRGKPLKQSYTILALDLPIPPSYRDDWRDPFRTLETKEQYSMRGLDLVIPSYRGKPLDIERPKTAQRRIDAWVSMRDTSMWLSLKGLGLRTLPAIPDNVQYLHCGNNKLETLPETLPSDLKMLYCYDNQLSTLPEQLPATLERLWCHDNYLTSLPALSPALNELLCHRNRLRTLSEQLPSTLERLWCGDNNLTSIPVASDNLKYFYGDVAVQ